MGKLLWLMPLLLLQGCGFIPRIPGGLRPIDPKTGEEIVNAFTIASDWMMYAGIICVIGGLLAIILLKRVITGGLVIVTGVSCFVFAQFLNFIGTHIIVFSLAFIALLAVACYMYFKAVTSGVPWLEKLLNTDLNHDGNKGTMRYEKVERDREDLESLENPES